MKARILAAAVVALTVLPVAPVAAAPSFETLGTDASLDAAPSFDLTRLEIRRAGKDLEIRIHIENMTPPWGSAIPYLPGVEWTFVVRGHTFVAEAYTDPTSEPGFLLFEQKGDAFTQLAELRGSYDWADGYVGIRIPLGKIGARSGTRISGVGKKGTNDVDFHIHLGPVTEYADEMATERDYIVP